MSGTFKLESGYSDRWVVLKVGKVPVFRFPNAKARVRAVRLHDLHHVATGYQTDWTGEAEIGAWEIGSGCGRFWAAWALNIGALELGMLYAPLRVYRAFIRGRHSNNLYDREYGEDLLELRVGELRRRLGVDRPARATTLDVVSFTF